MRLVIDTNIVFSALITGGKTRECIITAPVELYAPEFFYTEFENHRETIHRPGATDRRQEPRTARATPPLGGASLPSRAPGA